LVQQAVLLLRGLGATRVHRINKPPFVIHSHCTMRMGLSADDSVLDENAEARWVRRLFIADNSALANGIGGPNPTLTTQALATRTAEKIFQRYFDGDTWVGKEAPVSSIDDRVTAAVLGVQFRPPGSPAPAAPSGRLAATGEDDRRRLLLGAAAAAAGAGAAAWRRRLEPVVDEPTEDAEV